MSGQGWTFWYINNKKGSTELDYKLSHGESLFDSQEDQKATEMYINILHRIVGLRKAKNEPESKSPGFL